MREAAESRLSGNHAPINGGGLNTQASGVSHIIQSRFTRNVSGSLGGAISNLGTTTLYGTSVRFNRGSAGGGIATGNANVTVLRLTVTGNIPDNCNPPGTIPGCVARRGRSARRRALRPRRAQGRRTMLTASGAEGSAALAISSISARSDMMWYVPSARYSRITVTAP